MKNLFYILIALIFFTILTSCTHSDFLLSSIKNSYDASWNKDSTEFAFVSIERIFRPATGLAKFPDGGESKDVFKRVAVYHYNIKNSKLTRIGEYNGIDFVSEIRIRGLRIIVNDTSVLYKIPSINDYQINKAYRFSTNHKDSIRIRKKIEELKQAYQYNFKTKSVSIFDTTLFNKLDTLPKFIHGDNREDNYINKLSLSDRGIFLKDIYPQSMRKYKKYILEGRGSKDVRDAIVEQEFQKLSKKDIKELINKMTQVRLDLERKAKDSDDYKIVGYSNRYDEYYKYMTEKLQNLLKSNN